MYTITVIMATVKVETTLACLLHMTAEGFQSNLDFCFWTVFGKVAFKSSETTCNWMV